MPAPAHRSGSHRRFRRPARASAVIGRTCAWLLIALTLAPFTAPFSTCDLAMLLTHGSAPAAHATATTVRPVAIDELMVDASPGPLLEEKKVDHAIVDLAVPSPFETFDVADGFRPLAPPSIVRVTLVPLRL